VLARRHYSVLAPRGFLFPSDLQSMGFGLPAGIGAKLAAPKRAVVVVMGDGGFLMTGLDLVTAAREGIPIVVVVFNDGQLNLIRLQQLKEFGRASGVDLLVPDLARFAESVGVRYRPVSGDVSQALREALAADGPTLLEVVVGDSRSITGVRAKSLARETVRKAIGPRAVEWIKKLR
jgi:acetolactate synthase I/II/III large subunit